MRKVRAVLALATFLLLLACSSTVQTDFDRQADFATYSTYSWYQSQEDAGPTEGASQLVDRRIRDAITDNLKNKGLSPVGPTEADLLVTYYTSLSPQTRVYTTGWGYGWGWVPHWRFGYGFWPGWSWTTAHTYHEGTIVIDIIDRGKNQLVWRGVTTRVLGKRSHTEEKIDQSLNRVFSSFPPA